MAGMIEMYLPADQFEDKVLRQGDIIRQVHLCGAINLASVLYSVTANSQDAASWTVPLPPKRGDAIVLSHSCEIAPENGVKLTSIILAPIRDINTATRPEKIEELIKSNLIDQAKVDASYLKYFYLPPNPLLEHAVGAIADFSKCFSLRKQCYQSLLDNKVIQLTPQAQCEMSLKLALYFHRS